MHLVARSSCEARVPRFVSTPSMLVARELDWMKLVNECHMRAFYEYGCAPVLVRIER